MNQILFKKKILYKSMNRGLKETDIILGNFTKENIDLLDSKQLILLDNFLDEPDIEIFNWVTKKTLPPQKHDNEILRMIQDFRK